MEAYDAIIVGGGHNGLILGNYLVRSGLSTLILERRIEVGGGLSTEEITLPGYLHNLHSYFHDTIDIMPPFVDLNLEEFNAKYTRPSVQVGIADEDGRAITIHTDLEKTYESIARVSRHDAETYREIWENYGEFMKTVVTSAIYSAPQLPSSQSAVLESSPEGLDFLRMGRLSPAEVVDEYFEDDLVKCLILCQLPIPRGILPDYHGLGTVIPLVVSQAESSQICMGGSHILAHALWRAFFSQGGMARGLQHVNKILVENNRARGVETLDGTRYFARKLVASSVDLKQTFLKLVGSEHLSEGFVKKVSQFKLDEFSIFGVHLALKEPPSYTSCRFDPNIDRAFKMNLGMEHPRDLQRMFSKIREDTLPEQLGLLCSVPTLFDPGQAPAGKHTALLWQPAPYNLEGDGADRWDEVKNDYMDSCIDKWRRYAPNLTDENILMRKALSPLDIERKISNMESGGVFMGRMILGQVEYFRPFPELSQFRTPIDNLYLCGSCCHPGGGITGGAALIAADIIVQDFGLEPWWDQRA